MQAYTQSKNDSPNGSQVALFIDFENVAISAEEAFGRLNLTIIIEAANQYGRCITRRAYGDWTRFGKYSQDLLQHSAEAIQLFHYGGMNDKNAADIQMVADILEMLFVHPDVDVYVLATGDSDFSAVARKLRSYGKKVIGIGLRGATSEVLVNTCDQFLIYDTIVEPKTRTQSYSLEQARQLLLDSMIELNRQYPDREILAASLKYLMLQKDPTFSEPKLGFSQFKDFLIELNDLVDVGSRDNQVVVSLRPSVVEKASKDPSIEYRRALDRDGLHLLDPYTRVDVLKDLHELLGTNPQRYTLESAAMHLKARYDSTNILRSRDEVNEAVKLVKFTTLIQPTPESWELDNLTIKPGVDQQTFIDICESVYVAALVNKNLPVNADLISKLLFGTVDKRARINQLLEFVKPTTPTSPSKSKQTKARPWPSRLIETPSLQSVLQEIESHPLSSKEVTLDSAAHAYEEGMRVRSTDFAEARNYYLKAVKIIYTLLEQNTPGVSTVDLELYLGSYCAGSAGAAFFRHDYPTALRYYQAFFAITLETEPVWDKLERLVQPMLSFYFTTAANQESIMLDASPGRQHPANIVNIVFNHPNENVQQRGVTLANELAQINPTMLRKIIQRLEAIVATTNGGENSDEQKTLKLLSTMINK